MSHSEICRWGFEYEPSASARRHGTSDAGKVEFTDVHGKKLAAMHVEYTALMRFAVWRSNGAASVALRIHEQHMAEKIVVRCFDEVIESRHIFVIRGDNERFHSSAQQLTKREVCELVAIDRSQPLRKRETRLSAEPPNHRRIRRHHWRNESEFVAGGVNLRLS